MAARDPSLAVPLAMIDAPKAPVVSCARLFRMLPFSER
jgi:hypothetical protein